MSERRFPCPPTLDRDTGRDLLNTIQSDSVEHGDTVIIDFSETADMTSPGGAWLIEIADWVRKQDGDYRFEGQQGKVADFMSMIEPGLEVRGEKEVGGESFLAHLGQETINAANEARDFFTLFVEAIYWTFIAIVDGRGFRVSLLFDELHEMGVRAIGINGLMNFLLGLIIAMLSAAQLDQFGATIYVADLVSIAFARELAAIMTAIVVSARTGAAIAAEISTMKVQEELDALRGMGLNQGQFLVAPKLLALLICLPCLAVLGFVSGIAGASLWGVFVLDIDATTWWNQIQTAVTLDDMFEGGIKTFVFAVAIVLIGCHNGFRVKGGSRGVGQMTTRAVVMDIFAIITIDMFFAAIFYYVL